MPYRHRQIEHSAQIYALQGATSFARQRYVYEKMTASAEGFCEPVVEPTRDIACWENLQCSCASTGSARSLVPAAISRCDWGHRSAGYGRAKRGCESA